MTYAHSVRPDVDGLASLRRHLERAGFLDEERERNLARQTRAGSKEALDDLFVSYLHLVVAIARRYDGRGLPLSDLVQEGALALLNSLTRFDPTRGVRLGAFARRSIEGAILRALEDQVRMIRLPRRVAENVSAIRRAQAFFERMCGRPPSDQELWQLVDFLMDADEYREALIATTLELTRWVQQTEPALAGPQLDAADVGSLGPADLCIAAEVSDAVAQSLRYLTERERRIVELRFGFDGGIPRSLQQVGDEFRITRERVRQIEEAALKKLRPLLESVA